MMDMRCPRCQNPHTLKATAIINSGNTMSATNGGAVAVGLGGPMVGSYASATHVQSLLASKLRPPVPPRRESPTAAIILLITSIVFSLIPAIVVMIAYANMDAFLNQGAHFDAGAPDQNSPNNPYVPGVYESNLKFLHNCEWVLGFAVVAIIACIVWMILTAPRRKAVYQDHLGRWQRAMYNWNQLYYCSVCDSIYLQATRQFTSLDTMHGLLFAV